MSIKFKNISERSAFGQGLLTAKMGGEKSENPFEDTPEATINKYEMWNEGFDTYFNDVDYPKLQEKPLYESGVGERECNTS